MAVLMALLLASLPLMVVLLVGAALGRRDRRRAEARARQVALTDAIHERLGPVVAPTVVPRAWGPWRVTIPVPFERPDLVASVVDLAHRTSDGAGTTPRPMEIVLTPQPVEEHPAWA